MLDTHRSHVADITVAVTPVTAGAGRGLRHPAHQPQGRIAHFEEKPAPSGCPTSCPRSRARKPAYLASMGIYIFGREALGDALSRTRARRLRPPRDPAGVPRLRVQAHVYRGYWEDVGTIALLLRGQPGPVRSPMPPFDFYDAARPVYTHPRFLPATKVEGCDINESLDLRGLHHHGGARSSAR